jgi:hypothetical protein
MNTSPFRSHPFGDHAGKIAQLASSDAEQLLSRANFVAPGRYRDLFQQHLETAMMFLNKAIAFDGVVEQAVPISANRSEQKQADLFTPTEENDSG